MTVTRNVVKLGIYTVKVYAVFSARKLACMKRSNQTSNFFSKQISSNRISKRIELIPVANRTALLYTKWDSR